MYSKEQYMEKIENREVTISDLLKYNMKQWKKIALISVVIFILISVAIVFKYRAGLKDGMEEQQETVSVSMQELTSAQQENIKEVLKYYKDLKTMEDYFMDSTYMSINAYNSRIYTSQYLVSSSVKGEAYKAYELYVNYINNGALKEEIEKTFSDNIKNVSDLIDLSVDNSYRQEERFKIDRFIINIRVNTPDEKISAEIMEMIKQKLDEYQQEVVNGLIKEHELKVLEESNFSGQDENVREKQASVESSMNDKRIYISGLESLMSEEEKAVLEQEKLKIKGQEELKSKREESAESTDGSKIPLVILIVFSLIASFIFVICMFSLYYFTNNKLKNRNEIVRFFDIPYIGMIKISPNASENKSVCKEIEILCRAKKIKDVFVSCIASVPEQLDLKALLSDITDVKTDIGTDISSNIAALESAKESKNVIIAVKYDSTSYGEIVEVLQKCEYLNIDVIGAVSIG